LGLLVDASRLSIFASRSKGTAANGTDLISDERATYKLTAFTPKKKKKKYEAEEKKCYRNGGNPPIPSTGQIVHSG